MNEDELRTYGQPGSRIEESPLEGTPGFEITGGSLGQGLSQAVGMALGERLRGDGARVYCLVSDGELQEGQVWEAAMSASHFRLGNLTVLIDNNHIQADGATAEVMGVEPVVERFGAFGFDTVRVDAHDHVQLIEALPLTSRPGTSPRAVVLETVPGKGVPMFERHHKVHYLRLAGRDLARRHSRARGDRGDQMTGAGTKTAPELWGEVKSADVAKGTVALWWLYQSGIILKTPGGTIVVVDPYLSDAVLQTYKLPRNVPAPLGPARGGGRRPPGHP